MSLFVAVFVREFVGYFSVNSKKAFQFITDFTEK